MSTGTNDEKKRCIHPSCSKVGRDNGNNEDHVKIYNVAYKKGITDAKIEYMKNEKLEIEEKMWQNAKTFRDICFLGKLWCSDIIKFQPMYCMKGTEIHNLNELVSDKYDFIKKCMITYNELGFYTVCSQPAWSSKNFDNDSFEDRQKAFVEGFVYKDIAHKIFNELKNDENLLIEFGSEFDKYNEKINTYKKLDFENRFVSLTFENGKVPIQEYMKRYKNFSTFYKQKTFLCHTNLCVVDGDINDYLKNDNIKINDNDDIISITISDKRWNKNDLLWSKLLDILQKANGNNNLKQTDQSSNSQEKYEHNTVLLKLHKSFIKIDTEIADLISKIWEVGINTFYSCGNHVYNYKIERDEYYSKLMCIGFQTSYDYTRFIEIIFNNQKRDAFYKNRLDSNKWTCITEPNDCNCSNNVRIYIHIYFIFPKEDYDDICKRVDKYIETKKNVDEFGKCDICQKINCNNEELKRLDHGHYFEKVCNKCENKWIKSVNSDVLTILGFFEDSFSDSEKTMDYYKMSFLFFKNLVSKNICAVEGVSHFNFIQGCQIGYNKGINEDIFTKDDYLWEIKNNQDKKIDL